MVSGAVIIGSPRSTSGFHPFTVYDFEKMKKEVGFRLITKNPFAVTHQYFLNDPGNYYLYSEGVLLDVRVSGEGMTTFTNRIRKELISSAKKAESLRALCFQRGDTGEWISDFDFANICGYRRENGGTIWEPYYDVIGIYPSKDSEERYGEIARDLLGKTKDARIENYKGTQERVYKNSIKRLS